jgi:LL-diaminopimelate aminotransferase
MITKVQMSERLAKLPPYLFAEVDRLKREALAEGRDVIDLGVGDPDLPTPRFIVEALFEAARDPANQRYALDPGLPELRQAIREWYEKRFQVILDPNTEVLPLIGSKEGIAHLPLALVNPGDHVLIPDPGYPPYRSGTVFAGGEPYLMPLLEERDFLPDLQAIDPKVLKRTTLMFLNYPNNPTAACVEKSFFDEVVRFAEAHEILVCHDAAYSEIAFDGYRPPSFLESKGAKSLGIEFHSLSKTFNMTGWRVGFAVGNADILRLLSKVKSNIDSGIFQAIQLAAVQALRKGSGETSKTVRVYDERARWVVSAFESLGWKIRRPRATFYLWIPSPPGYTSKEIALKFLKEADLVVTPGNGFGPNGEGYFRISLTVATERLREAVKRIQRMHRSLKQ